MFLVNRTHQRRSWREGLVDKDENSLFRRELDALPDHVYELTDGQILSTDGWTVGSNISGSYI